MSSFNGIDANVGKYFGTRNNTMKNVFIGSQKYFCK